MNTTFFIQFHKKQLFVVAARIKSVSVSAIKKRCSVGRMRSSGECRGEIVDLNEDAAARRHLSFGSRPPSHPAAPPSLFFVVVVSEVT